MVHVKFRKYDPERDFLRVRDLLTNHYLIGGRPFNWGIERWNYARYFVAPMLGAQRLANTSMEDIQRKSQEAISIWENSIGIWENGFGEIVGVVNPEEYSPKHPGMPYFQRHPGYNCPIGEMIGYAEVTFADNGIVRMFVSDHDKRFQALAAEHGYLKESKSCGYYMEYDLEQLPESDLPQEYQIISMADDNDLEKRRKVLGLSFGHKDPNDWPTLFSYQELQRAPDYHKELDIVVANTSGEYLACCIVWLDEHNKIAHLEPVGSIRLGLGRQVVLEGLRRAVALGANKAIMESDLRFYEKIGFKNKCPLGHIWTKEKSKPGK
jgi:predicted N-acetyltransferase YhbS